MDVNYRRGISVLEVELVLNNTHRLRWFGDLIKIEKEKQVKRRWKTKSPLKRTNGRRRKIWHELVAENLRKKKEQNLERKKGFGKKHLRKLRFDYNNHSRHV